MKDEDRDQKKAYIYIESIFLSNASAKESMHTSEQLHYGCFKKYQPVDTPAETRLSPHHFVNGDGLILR